MPESEFRSRTQQLILHQQHFKESGRIPAKPFAVEAFVVGYRMLVLQPSLVGQCLTRDVHQIILKIIVAAISVCHTVHQPGSLLRIGRIVIILHLRPTAGLEVVQRWTTAEDTLMRTLLVVANRTVIDAIHENHPSLFYRSILHAVACLHIVFYPSLLSELLRSPGQFAHQLKHHGIVLRTLHRKPDTLAVPLV